MGNAGKRLVFLGKKRRRPYCRRQYGILSVAIGVRWVAAKHLGFREFCERLKAYLVKAVREAGESTSWVSPDAAYEASIIGFVDWLTINPSARLVRKNLARYAQAIDKTALNKSLSQVVLKLATPGVPDIYQGQEARDFSFVDPDNRCPIDFAARSRILDSLISHSESSLRLLRQSSGGEHAKEFVTWRMLQLRREGPDLFELGEYLPLKPSGDGANRVMSFARRYGDRWLIILAPRLTHPALVDALATARALEPGRCSSCPLDVQRPGEMSFRAKESGLQERPSRLPGPSRTAFRSSFATCEPLAVLAGSTSGEVASLVSVVVKAHPDTVGAPRCAGEHKNFRSEIRAGPVSIGLTASRRDTSGTVEPNQ